MAEALASCTVQELRSGETLEASKLLSSSGVFFLTHWGDFNSWEVAQQVRSAIQAQRLDASKVCLVGIGSQSSGAKFAEMLELPKEIKIYSDLRADCYRALCFSRGALPQYSEQLNPYLRVFLMLLGVGCLGKKQLYQPKQGRLEPSARCLVDTLGHLDERGRSATLSISSCSIHI